MASPKTMFSGSIELSLVNIPVTIAKATSESREQSLVSVCNHGDAAGVSKIDKSERCPQCDGPPQHKARALDMGDGTYRIISENEMSAIEVSTKTPTLKVEDVQPLSSLPLIYSTGTYYVRHDDKAKVAPKAFKALAMALQKERLGLICKWGNSSRQKLCVLSVESGVMLLRVIPFLNDVRVASKKEREHFKVEVTEAEAAKMGELLNSLRNEDGFQYGNYADEGLKLRQEAVDRILAGLEPKKVETPTIIEQDIFAMVEDAITETKKAAKV